MFRGFVKKQYFEQTLSLDYCLNYDHLKNTWKNEDVNVVKKCNSLGASL